MSTIYIHEALSLLFCREIYNLYSYDLINVLLGYNDGCLHEFSIMQTATFYLFYSTSRNFSTNDFFLKIKTIISEIKTGTIMVSKSYPR